MVVVVIIWGGYKLLQSNTATGPGEGEKIKIGFIGPQTGDAVALGESALAAAKIAVDEVNTAGGVKGKIIELVAEDSGCNPTGGTNAVSKLVNVDKVKAIVGGLCSAETAPAAPIAQEAGVPMVSYCASAPGITKVGDYIFRVYPSDIFQGPFNAEYAYTNIGKKAAVLYVQNDWGQGMHDGFTAKFKELGGEVVYAEGVTQDSRDMRTQITKIKDSGTALIAFFAYPEGAIAGLKQMKELGVKLPIIGGDAFDDPKIGAEAKEAAEGVRYTVPKVAVPDEFNQKLVAASGKEAKICAPQAYDAVKLLAKVVEEVGTEGQAVRDKLAATANYEGVSGAITFNEDGDILNADYDIKVFKSGKAEVVQMEAAKTEKASGTEAVE